MNIIALFCDIDHFLFFEDGAFMVDFRITWTLLVRSQPPKSPLSGGL